MRRPRFANQEKHGFRNDRNTNGSSRSGSPRARSADEPEASIAPRCSSAWRMISRTVRPSEAVRSSEAGAAFAAYEAWDAPPDAALSL